MRKHRLRDLGNLPKVTHNGIPHHTPVQTHNFSISISLSLVQGSPVQFQGPTTDPLYQDPSE